MSNEKPFMIGPFKIKSVTHETCPICKRDGVEVLHGNTVFIKLDENAHIVDQKESQPEAQWQCPTCKPYTVAEISEAPPCH